MPWEVDIEAVERWTRMDGGRTCGACGERVGFVVSHEVIVPGRRADSPVTPDDPRGWLIEVRCQRCAALIMLPAAAILAGVGPMLIMVQEPSTDDAPPTLTLVPEPTN